MAKHIDSTLAGFKIDDLICEDGITFEIGEEFCDDDEEEFSYTPNVQFSNEDMLNMLNMNDFDDDEDEDTEKGLTSLCGITFAKLKTKMMDLTADKKVMKFVKQKGIGEVVPHNGQVTIHYIGHLEHNDEPFDSTYTNGKARSLRLNQNCIIPGLEIGLRTMRKHEIAIFWMHPDYAFGAIGCPPRIPSNVETVFVVHLIDYLDDGSADTYQNLTREERQLYKNIVEPVTHMLVTAKDYFLKFNVKRAIQEYKKVIDSLETVKLNDALEEEEMNELLSKAYTNLGICYNKLDMPRRACIACRRVPIPTAKSHYNFGKALLNLGEYTEAMKELQVANTLEPSNHSIKKLIQLTNAKQRQYLEIEKRLWKNCFKSNNEQRKDTGFRQAARDFCKNIVYNNEVMRQSLPEGLTEEECLIIREEAAILGLDVVTSSRYGKDITYIQKNKA